MLIDEKTRILSELLTITDIALTNGHFPPVIKERAEAAIKDWEGYIQRLLRTPQMDDTPVFNGDFKGTFGVTLPEKVYR